MPICQRNPTASGDERDGEAAMENSGTVESNCVGHEILLEIAMIATRHEIHPLRGLDRFDSSMESRE